MARRSETKLFEEQKLSSPNGKNEWMIQGRPDRQAGTLLFSDRKKAKKAAADRNRQVTAFGSQTALPEAERVMAAECIKMLALFGKTLYDTAHFYRDHLEKTCGKFEKEPPPLTPEEAKRLLDAAEPEILAFIALGLFAGLRTAERDELNWRDIHLSGPEPEIDLEKKISKTGRRRSVPIQPALKAFLEPHAYQNAWERAVQKARLWPWPENALRDSFVSYRYKSREASKGVDAALANSFIQDRIFTAAPLGSVTP